MTPRVVIVGGGIAGLAAAYELSSQQVPFVLLESGPRAGGVILSEQIGGFTVDAGPDSLLVQKPDALKLCEVRRGFRAEPPRHEGPNRLVGGVTPSWNGDLGAHAQLAGPREERRPHEGTDARRNAQY